MSERRTLHPSTPRPELDALFEQAKGHKLTKAERDAQRKSWVIGNMMLAHPEMTRERAEAVYVAAIDEDRL